MRRIVLLLAPWLALAMGCDRSESVRQRDLIVLSVETLRSDALGYAGHPGAATPNLDALVARGTRFAQAITPMPRTSPALASLMTGLWPHHHGSREVGDAMTGGIRLAEVLRGQGYGTLAVVGNHSAGPAQGFDRGFERFVSYDDLVERYRGRLYRDGTDVPPTAPGWAEVTTDEALALVSQSSPGKPLLLWVFYFDPHFLYRPPSPWQERAVAPRCWELYRWALADPGHRGGQVFNDIRGVARQAAEDCRKLYDAEVAYTDSEIGRLLRDFRKARGNREPLVLFTADHGENFGEEGLFFEHGENVHEAGLSVPLAWVGPGVAAGRVDQGAASLVDALPTTLALLGVPEKARPPVDGMDLSPFLAAGGHSRGREEPRVVFAESANALWNQAFGHLLTGRAGGRVCVNQGRYSLCEQTHERPGVYELYDHEADPELEHNLASRLPEVVARLSAVRQVWPVEGARLLAARQARFKLVGRPRAEGGYHYELYDLAGAGESVDVSAAFPAVAAKLQQELERWAAGIRAEPRSERSREQEDVLRGLHYLG
ncbi:MAG TPA: sulfatase [Thermoanaerobaculia bacterium]|nr:sulfatase [Thermoanaerobaculia bacterium]